MLKKTVKYKYYAKLFMKSQLFKKLTIKRGIYGINKFMIF